MGVETSEASIGLYKDFHENEIHIYYSSLFKGKQKSFTHPTPPYFLVLSFGICFSFSVCQIKRDV